MLTLSVPVFAWVVVEFRVACCASVEVEFLVNKLLHSNVETLMNYKCKSRPKQQCHQDVEEKLFGCHCEWCCLFVTGLVRSRHRALLFVESFDKLPL